MSGPINDMFGARLDDAPEPSELMGKRVFGKIDADARSRRLRGLVFRYAAAVALVVVGGTVATSFSHRDVPSQPAMVGVERARVPNTIAVSASVTLGVRDVARATRAIRALPHVEVTSVGPRDLHLHLPSRAYRATLDRLAALGTMQHLDERRDNLDSALATAAHQPPTASSANALVNLRDRIAFAHLDVHLEPI